MPIWDNEPLVETPEVTSAETEPVFCPSLDAEPLPSALTLFPASSPELVPLPPFLPGMIKKSIDQIVDMLRNEPFIEVYLNPADLEKALSLQAKTGRVLGEVLVDMGVVSREEVKGALSLQRRQEQSVKTE
jgi:hypothetical protein